jgi:hypothetical protein
MATASSGKGFCSMAGISMILSNIDPRSDGSIAEYLDLQFYALKNKIPYTISSNLIQALYAGARLKLTTEKFALTAIYSAKIKIILEPFKILPFNNFHVFTLSLHERSCIEFSKDCRQNNILISAESDYLKKKNWLQLALFGNYEVKEFACASERFNSVLQRYLITGRNSIPKTIIKNLPTPAYI